VISSREGRRRRALPERERGHPVTVLSPEIVAGGFTRHDVTVEFYSRVNALLRPDMTVVDFGAGRGLEAEDPIEYRRALATLRGKVARVIGVDIDPVVLTNPLIDEAVVVGPDGRVPLADGVADLVLADQVLEHVDRPGTVAAELDRLLKPGGWLCARTPNRWGYVAVAARVVPNRHHVSVLARVFPHRDPQDVFPTRYRMNTARALRRLFPPERYDGAIYATNADPNYFGLSLVAWRVGATLQRLMPTGLGTVLLVFLRKR
jgi:SAM-dependent methyltransferase